MGRTADATSGRKADLQASAHVTVVLLLQKRLCKRAAESRCTKSKPYTLSLQLSSSKDVRS